MNVTLKNVKFSEHMSEETNAFTADVYVDGVRCGYAKNDGCGGNTNVHPYSFQQSELFYKGETFLKTQPQINIGTEETPFMVESNMENVVDQLFEQWLKEKDKKKLEKKMETHLMWGIPNGSNYMQINFKKPLLTLPQTALQSYINGIKAGFKDGQQFLNTNLVGFEL
jgi:hypothetical protein